jgi:hypothetical protein
MVINVFILTELSMIRMSNTCGPLESILARDTAGNCGKVISKIECPKTEPSLGAHLLVDARVGPPLDLRVRW